MQSERQYPSVRYWSKEINGTLLGAKKIIFLIREIDDAPPWRPRRWNPVNSWSWGLSPRSPRVVTIHVQSPTPHARPLPSVDMAATLPAKPSHLPMICQRFRSRALLRAPRTGACGVGDYPTPDLSRRSPRADLHPKKVNNLGPMAPVPVKNVNYPRAPSSRRSGLVGPHTTPPIVNYKYMTSTP